MPAKVPYEHWDQKGTCILGIAALDYKVLVEAGGTSCKGPSEMEPQKTFPHRHVATRPPRFFLPSYLVSHHDLLCQQYLHPRHCRVSRHGWPSNPHNFASGMFLDVGHPQLTAALDSPRDGAETRRPLRSNRGRAVCSGPSEPLPAGVILHSFRCLSSSSSRSHDDAKKTASSVLLPVDRRRSLSST